jgi:hypothetical protein
MRSLHVELTAIFGALICLYGASPAAGLRSPHGKTNNLLAVTDAGVPSSVLDARHKGDSMSRLRDLQAAASSVAALDPYAGNYTFSNPARGETVTVAIVSSAVSGPRRNSPPSRVTHFHCSMSRRLPAALHPSQRAPFPRGIRAACPQWARVARRVCLI